MTTPRNAIRSLLVVGFVACISACSYSVHELYIGSVDPGVNYGGRGRWVEAESSKFVILGFEMNSKYVEEAYHKLEGHCSGRIAQVTTEHLTAYKLLSYEQKVILKGLCLG